MFKTVLVALDEAKLAVDLLTALKQLQWSSDMTLVLSHVMLPSEDVPERDAALPGPAPLEITYQKIEEDWQQQKLTLPEVQAVIEVVLGDPAEEIVRLANIHQADLIVLGNRGLTGLSRILKGSVSSQVLEAAPCSVMVIKLRVSDNSP